MSFSLVMPAASTVEDLADHVTRKLWNLITATPELERLYPGYYVAIHSVVLRHLDQLLTSVTRESDGRQCLVYEGLEDAESFREMLAGAIVVRLDEVLRRAHAVALMDHGISCAVSGALPVCHCAAAKPVTAVALGVVARA